MCCPQPVQAVDWPEGTPAPYLAVARAVAGMEGTTKRLLKDEVLVELFSAILQRCPGEASLQPDPGQALIPPFLLWYH